MTSFRAILRCALALCWSAAFAAGPLRAQSAEYSAADSGSTVHPTGTRAIRAIERAGQVDIDGRLDEAAWAAAPAATDFTQQEPIEGAPATQRTEVRFLYDATALYIGARMYDSLGIAGVRTRLARRDAQTESDVFQVVLDTYHDHLTQRGFSVNPSGVKGDGDNGDDSWDPIWDVATSIDSLGWIAEIRIPLSQLRFSRDTLQTWGVQLWRVEQRLHETSMFSYWSPRDVGGPSRFAHLRGIHLEDAPRGFELLPYAVARAEYIRPATPGDPFNDGSESNLRVGADLKYRLSSNFTLDATFNPDFGQVEVDPAVVNLSAFETFFEERRPFFVEGAGVFSFGGFSCHFCSNVEPLSLFYSRRLGRAPQGFAGGDFVDMPEAATILGAGKVTGRTQGGWTVGVLEAVTREERATSIDMRDDGSEIVSHVPVEPLSNYTVARVKRDLNGGNVQLGALATSVYRDLPDATLQSLLNRHAEAAGVDANIHWHQRRYALSARVAVSNISGDSLAMARAQRSSARYFQRPDHDGGSPFDPSATSMRGVAGYARLSKEAGEWLFEASTNFRSPGFEVNDLAFMSRADYAWMSSNVMRLFTRPNSWRRSAAFITGSQQEYNFDGDLTGRDVHLFGQVSFLNYWTVSAFAIRQLEAFDPGATRGGPAVKKPAATFYSSSLSSDSRKPVILSLNQDFTRIDDGAESWTSSASVTIKPSSNVRLTMGPSFRHAASHRAFVTSVAAQAGDTTANAFFKRHYIFADLSQRQLSLETRLGITFTPSLTLELYAQPLLASGDYSHFKEYVRPRTTELMTFGEGSGSITTSGSGFSTQYSVDKDGDGATDFGFAPNFPNSDFNFASLRGNAVLRWEYSPGSTVYFVWTQQRSALSSVGDLAFDRQRRELFDAHPDNVFLVKLSYWLGR